MSERSAAWIHPAQSDQSQSSFHQKRWSNHHYFLFKSRAFELVWQPSLLIRKTFHNGCNYSIFRNHFPPLSHCARMSPLSFLIIRSVWSFVLLRVRSGDGDVPPAEELHSEPRGWLLLCLCGCSWNRPRVSNDIMMNARQGHLTRSRRVRLS